MAGSTHLHTTDGGLTWIKLSGTHAWDVHLVTISKGFVAGCYGMSLRMDLGLTWSRANRFDDSTHLGVVVNRKF